MIAVPAEGEPAAVGLIHGRYEQRAVAINIFVGPPLHETSSLTARRTSLFRRLWNKHTRAGCPNESRCARIKTVGYTKNMAGDRAVSIVSLATGFGLILPRSPRLVPFATESIRIRSPARSNEPV